MWCGTSGKAKNSIRNSVIFRGVLQETRDDAQALATVSCWLPIGEGGPPGHDVSRKRNT
jgi:hypothetical protein